MDDWGSAWKEAQERGEMWGGRGKGGRGIQRNTWQPKDIYVEGEVPDGPSEGRCEFGRYCEELLSVSISFMFRVQPRAFAGFLLKILLDVCTGDTSYSIPPKINDKSEKNSLVGLQKPQHEGNNAPYMVGMLK